MPKLTLNIKYSLEERQVISANDIRKNFLWGVDLQRFGNYMDDEVLNFHIKAAIKQFESFLQLKFTRQVIKESKDFSANDWKTWGYIKTTYPVVEPIELEGFIGKVQQVNYPKGWLSIRRANDDLYTRQIHLVPSTSATNNELVVYSGIMPNLGYMSNSSIPNYWTLKYLTGFDIVPADILNVICKLATINIMAAASDGLLFSPGVSSQSISLDGLSQSISGFANGQSSVFGARIKQYAQEIEDEKSRLFDTYAAVVWGCF